MHATNPSEKIIATLREQLKAKGYHHRDVATRLQVSEGTVKRYLNGKGVTIDVLQRLAEIVGLNLISLAALAGQADAVVPELNKTQQVALVKSPLLRLIYFWLLSGWTLSQIEREYGITPQRLESVLKQLQSLALIRRLSTRGVQILARPNYERRREGELAELTFEGGNEFLREVNLRDPKSEWAAGAARLSPASATRMRKIIRDCMHTFLALTIADLDVPADQVQWYRMFIGAHPVSRKKLLRSF